MAKNTATGSKKVKKAKSGADSAPRIPEALTKVAEGHPALSLEEVIDRLYEVVAGDTEPGAYGLASREEAESLLDKSMGAEGKAALARARAAYDTRPAPVSPRPAAALDPAGPDDDGLTPEEVAADAADILQARPGCHTSRDGETILVRFEDGAEGGRYDVLTSAAFERPFSARAGENAADLVARIDAHFAEQLRLVSEQVGPEVALETHAQPHLDDAAASGRELDAALTDAKSGAPLDALLDTAPTPPAEHREARTVAREERVEQLRKMTHEELEAAYGKPSTAKDSLIRCWIIVKEFGSGKAGASTPARHTRTANSRPNTPESAAARLVVQVQVVQQTLKGFDFASLGDQSVAGAGQRRVQALEEHLGEVLATARYWEGASRAAPSTGAAAPAAAVEVGSKVDVATRFASKYDDALTAEEQVGLTVEQIGPQKGVARCKTADGDEVLIPVAHLVAAA